MNAEFETRVARADPDRRLAALFAAPLVRRRLFALYAFYQEIAQVPETVSEPVIGEMRLAWAREAVEDIYKTPANVRRHEVYEALADLRHEPGGPDRDELIAMIEARGADLGQGPFPTTQDRRDYVDRTSVALMRAAVRIAKPDFDFEGESAAAVNAAGRLWGFAGLARAFPALAAAGRPPFAAEEMAAEGLSEHDLLRGRKAEAARAAMKGLFAEARAAASELKRTRSALPAEAFPAVGYAGLARGYLRAAMRADDPYREPVERPLHARQWRLMWGSLTGRI